MDSPVCLWALRFNTVHRLSHPRVLAVPGSLADPGRWCTFDVLGGSYQSGHEQWGAACVFGAHVAMTRMSWFPLAMGDGETRRNSADFARHQHELARSGSALDASVLFTGFLQWACTCIKSPGFSGLATNKSSGGSAGLTKSPVKNDLEEDLTWSLSHQTSLVMIAMPAHST